MNQLVTTDWLDKNIEKVKILDASWHLPIANRNSFEEYKSEHIVNSIFFDIDRNSNQKTSGRRILYHENSSFSCSQRSFMRASISANETKVLWEIMRASARPRRGSGPS